MSRATLSIRDVSAQTAFSRQRVYRLIATGQLRAVRVGDRGHWRVLASSLDEFLSGAPVAHHAPTFTRVSTVNGGNDAATAFD